MKKFAVFILLIFVAMIVAGVYGVLHDQISYTISPEYYTRFKFEQFGLSNSPLPERVRAGIVGFLASWWMGIPIGVLVGSAGFLHRGYRRTLRVTLQSYILVVGVALLVSLLGLVYGFLNTGFIDLAAYEYWYIPEGIVDLRRYLCVGYMHNAAYLGGALAIPAAWVFHAIARARQQ